MAGKVALYEDKADGCRFRPQAGTGEVIATSERYAAKPGAQNGIDSVKSNAADAPVDDLT